MLAEAIRSVADACNPGQLLLGGRKTHKGAWSGCPASDYVAASVVAARLHIIPSVGHKRLRDLRAHDVDKMPSTRGDRLST